MSWVTTYWPAQARRSGPPHRRRPQGRGTRTGLPARDLAYFTGTSLDPDTRAACEESLVDVYHRALLDYGVTGYTPEMCWQDYRFGMVQAPLIIALGAAFATPTARGEEIFLVMLERSCRAIRDLGTLALIGATD